MSRAQGYVDVRLMISGGGDRKQRPGAEAPGRCWRMAPYLPNRVLRKSSDRAQTSVIDPDEGPCRLPVY